MLLSSTADNNKLSLKWNSFPRGFCGLPTMMWSLLLRNRLSILLASRSLYVLCYSHMNFEAGWRFSYLPIRFQWVRVFAQDTINAPQNACGLAMNRRSEIGFSQLILYLFCNRCLFPVRPQTLATACCLFCQVAKQLSSQSHNELESIANSVSKKARPPNQTKVGKFGIDFKFLGRCVLFSYKPYAPCFCVTLINT